MHTLFILFPFFLMLKEAYYILLECATFSIKIGKLSKYVCICLFCNNKYKKDKSEINELDFLLVLVGIGWKRMRLLWLYNYILF